MVKTTIFSAAATFILATYKDNKSAQKVFDIMVSRERDCWMMYNRVDGYITTILMTEQQAKEYGEELKGER